MLFRSARKSFFSRLISLHEYVSIRVETRNAGVEKLSPVESTCSSGISMNLRGEAVTECGQRGSRIGWRQRADFMLRRGLREPGVVVWEDARRRRGGRVSVRV